MPGVNVPTDFFRYLVLKGLAMFDDVGVRILVPPGAVLSVEYAPPNSGEVWLLYYMSFGDIPADAFAVKCRFMQSKYGGMAFAHECRPMGRDVIDPGCLFFCPLARGYPFEVTIENLTDSPQVFSARLWQLKIAERDMPLVVELYDEFVQSARLRESVERLAEAIQKLAEALRPRGILGMLSV
jgi:hypothetical protein